MIIKTSNKKSIKPFLTSFYIPNPDSHKGQNGKVLIIGGSSLFHAASIWSASVSSHFVDMVHYTSTKENEEILTSLKKKFTNGIIVPREHLPDYVAEDDTVLIGPGMTRGPKTANKGNDLSFAEILKLTNESQFTQTLTKYLIDSFPEKKFVFDAGALQMMDPAWLSKLKTKPIVTPHQKEFQELFGISLIDKSLEEKSQIASATAKKYKCVILLKAIADIVTDGDQTIIVEGGNAGLTKGGSGDVLAGLTASLFTKNPPVQSAVIASYILKQTAEKLSMSHGYWYNIDNLIETIPMVMKENVL